MSERDEKVFQNISRPENVPVDLKLDIPASRSYSDAAIALTGAAGSGLAAVGCYGFEKIKGVEWAKMASAAIKNVEYARDLTLSTLPKEATDGIPAFIKRPFIRGDFKSSVGFEERVSLFNSMRKKHPDKLCIVIEKASWSKLPQIQKSRFIVPEKMTIAEFTFVIRSKFEGLESHQGIYFIANGNYLTQRSMPMSEIHKAYADSDGIIYIRYSEENIFG